MNPIIGGMATIPDRRTTAPAVIESILPQVDRLYVVLNGHQSPLTIEHPKLTQIFSDNRYGDAAKFLHAAETQGYYFSFDDDLIYPAEYVQNTICALQKYRNQIVVSYHGKVFYDHKVMSFIRAIDLNFKCLERQDNDYWIHAPGTGVMAFHTKYFHLEMSYFPTPNMADIWVGRQAQIQNRPILCLSHAANYFKRHPYEHQGRQIWEETKKEDSHIVRVINETDWTLFYV